MSYPKDLVGKVVRLPQIPRRAVNGRQVGAEEAQVSIPVFSLHPTEPKVHVAPNWDVNWLSYIPGMVTTATLNRPVLTGPMSGCFLFCYQVGGMTRVAHVGTSASTNDPLSIAAKRSWKRYAETNDLSQVQGVDPFAQVSNDVLLAHRGPRGDWPDQFVLFAPGGKVYGIVIAHHSEAEKDLGDRANVYAGVQRVTHVSRLNLSPWSAISNLPQFTRV